MSFLGARPDSFQYGSTAYDHFNGDGVTTTFTLSRQVSANADIQVVVNNVIQDPGVAYYVSNLNTLTFTGAPTSGTNNIYVVYRQMVQSGIAPGANTVTMSAIAANTIQPWQLSNSLLNPLVSTFTGDGSTVTFTLTQAAVSSNSCYVTVNGITQGSPANYSTNGATLTFTSAPAANSTIRVVQNSVVGTSIVPVDGSVTNSKLASNLTLTGSTILPIISGNTSITGSIKANNGLYSSNNFTGTYTDGIVMDYVTGNGRISVGGGDGLTFYNGGPATTALMTLTSGGSLGIGTTSPRGKLHVNATTNQNLVFGGPVNFANGVSIASTNDAYSQNYPMEFRGGSLLFTSNNSDSSGGNIVFNAGGEGEKMRLDSSGNLGLGGAPLSWQSGYSVFQLGTTSSFSVNTGGLYTFIGNNFYINSSGGINYAATGPGAYYSINRNAGIHQWSTVLPGTQGTSATANASQIMTLTAGGVLQLSSTTGGIQFNNSSALNNSVLNDYETGTWTPTWSSTGGGVSGLTQTATYTKIGRIVTVNISVSGTAASGTANPTINNLPFTCASVGSSSGIAREWNQTGYFWGLNVTGGGTSVGLWRYDNANTLPVGSFGFYMTYTYQASF